jgi:MFS family permease
MEHPTHNREACFSGNHQWRDRQYRAEHAGVRILSASSVMEWGVLTYILTVSSPRLSFGRLGDMFGNKNLFIAGMVSFTRGSEVGMITADLRVKRLQCAAGERFGEPHGIGERHFH